MPSTYAPTPQKSCPSIVEDMVDGRAVPDLQTSRNDEREATTVEEPRPKKAKTTCSDPTSHKVYAFSVDSSPVYVEVLSCHTLWHLVDIIFRECDPRGEGETANCHMWNLKLPGSPQLLESGEIACFSRQRARQTELKEKARNWSQGSQLHLEYDYGTTTNHVLTVCGIWDLDSSVNTTEFPRRQPEESPVGPSSFQTDSIDLNLHYPSLNRWAFESATKSTQVNLFQAGRRNVHGYLERDGGGTMIFLPEKVSSLEHYLKCLERATSVRACGGYTWHSVVALPEESERLDTYNNRPLPGFRDCLVIPVPAISSDITLKDIFPKVAALGGFRKDKKIKKGWIRYTNQVLMVVVGSGSPTKPPSNPKGLAWDGRGCHVPGDNAEVLFRVQKKIASIHELFCEVEGQLSKL